MPTQRVVRLAICVVIAGATLVWLLVMLVPRSPPSEPNWSFEFPYDSNVAVDMHLSPDGRSLAVVSADARSRLFSKQATWVYEIPSGKLRNQIEGGSWQCAWNADGTILAVATWTGWDFDLWDTKTWAHKRHLSIGLSPTEKRIVRFVLPVGLCFDRDGNLYTAEPYNGWDGNVALSRAKVWWNATSVSGEAVSIGTCPCIFDVSAAPRGLDTRVAISNENAECTLEIFRVQNPAGKRIVRREYSLNVSQAHGLVLAWVSLTNDGRYLVARDSAQFCLFELFDDQAKLVYSRSDRSASSETMLRKKVLDVSINGRFAAYGSEHRVRVVRIADGQTALEIQQEPDSLALSPDGRLLAVASRPRKSILFYRIPQGKND
jgi:WD40 repeat protein